MNRVGQKVQTIICVAADKGRLSSIKLGRVRLVNVAALSRDALDKEDY